MTQQEHTYIAIDLKSFYASVECMDRGLDPLTTNLVVADISRTQKTICLAVSPSMKAYGIPGRPRLFEVVQRMKEVNLERSRRISASGEKTLRSDAADAAIEYGVVCSAVYPFIGYLETNFKGAEKALDVNIGCDFENEAYFGTDIKIKLRIIHIVRALMRSASEQMEAMNEQ
jgi:hypothetical protein